MVAAALLVAVLISLEAPSGNAEQDHAGAAARPPSQTAAAPDPAAPSQVDVLIAWELSWYRYRVDLGDVGETVVLVDKGEELDQLEGEPPDWNVQASPDGTLALGVGSRP